MGFESSAKDYCLSSFLIIVEAVSQAIWCNRTLFVGKFYSTHGYDDSTTWKHNYEMTCSCEIVKDLITSYKTAQKIDSILYFMKMHIVVVMFLLQTQHCINELINVYIILVMMCMQETWCSTILIQSNVITWNALDAIWCPVVKSDISVA